MKRTTFFVMFAVSVLLAASLVAFAPPDVQAGNKKVWAADFKPAEGLQNYSQYTDLHALMGFEGLRFFAKVKMLKPGSRAALTPPADFEGADYTLRLSFKNGREINDHIAFLQRIVTSDLLKNQ